MSFLAFDVLKESNQTVTHLLERHQLLHIKETSILGLKLTVCMH